PPILELIADQTTWERPTAIQRVVVPAVLTGQSVVASACTGQGKTAAFGLPILNLIHNYKKMAAPLALILAPSYDLASQILEDLNLFGNPLGVHSVILSNESTYEKQLQRLDPTVDIIVGTPGRILTHIKKSMEAADPGALTITNPRLDLSRLRHFVVDECDRLFGLGFLPDVQAIWQALPRPDHRMQRTVQMVITSATIVPAVHNFILRVAPVHRLLDLNATLAVPKTVTQLLYEVSKPRKLSLLLHFLKRRGNVSLREGKVLVFTRTISRCERIAEGLREKRYTAAALNSDCTNAQRKAILTDFALGHISVVVATDIATRGLDIPGLTHVINFDVPNNVEDYIHRVGRTGRAGEKGTAITFVCKEKEEFYLNDHQLVVR
ncbi:DEAD/DEAH box helicase domain protein, partial [Dimargaris cristalligena]